MITVYTAVFKNYDALDYDVEPECGIDYVVFTDGTSAGRGWHCITSIATEPNARRENRKFKTLSHRWFPKSAWTIYMDGNIRLKIRPREIIDSCQSISSDAPLFLFPHNARDCVYAEAATCIYSRLDDPAKIRSQVRRYRRAGFSAHSGLWWGGFIVRRSGCEAFNELWWREIKSGSARDQISLPYAIKLTGTAVGILPGAIPFYGGTSDFCRRIDHNR